MPKGRYRIMTAYMPKVGKYGLDMMYRTCTVECAPGAGQFEVSDLTG
jgi:gamma-glutamylcysteine synthetase